MPVQCGFHLQLFLLDTAIFECVIFIDKLDCENVIGGGQRRGFLYATKMSAIAEQLEQRIGHRITRRMLPCQSFVTQSEKEVPMAAAQAASVVFRSF